MDALDVADSPKRAARDSQHGLVKPRRGWRKALMQMGGVSCLMVAHDESATAHGWQWLTVCLWVFWSLMILKNENEA